MMRQVFLLVLAVVAFFGGRLCTGDVGYYGEF